MNGLFKEYGLTVLASLLAGFGGCLSTGCAMFDQGGQTRRALRQTQLIDWNTDKNEGPGQLWVEGDGTQEQTVIAARGKIVLTSDGNGGFVIDPERSEIAEYIFIDPKADQAVAAFAKIAEEGTKQSRIVAQSFDKVIEALVPLIPVPGPGPVTNDVE